MKVGLEKRRRSVKRRNSIRKTKENHHDDEIKESAEERKI